MNQCIWDGLLVFANVLYVFAVTRLWANKSMFTYLDGGFFKPLFKLFRELIQCLLKENASLRGTNPQYLLWSISSWTVTSKHQLLKKLQSSFWIVAEVLVFESAQDKRVHTVSQGHTNKGIKRGNNPKRPEILLSRSQSLASPEVLTLELKDLSSWASFFLV